MGKLAGSLDEHTGQIARTLTMASSAAVFLFVSWLYTAKCLTCDSSPVLCTPSISLTASEAFR